MGSTVLPGLIPAGSVFGVASTTDSFADVLYPTRWFPFDAARELVPTVALKPGVDAERYGSVVFGVSTREVRLFDGEMVSECSSLARERASLREGVRF